MLEAGHTPQHLLAHLSSDAGLTDSLRKEISHLQQQGHPNLAAALQRRAGLASTAAGEPGLLHYAAGTQLRARLQRLNQERGVQHSAASNSAEQVVAMAGDLLKAKQLCTAVHWLCSHAEAHPYNPRIEQALAEAAAAEENWIGAHEHWQQILRSSATTSLAVEAKSRLNALEASEGLKRHQTVMRFDQLLFEERFLTHGGPLPLPFASTTDAAAAFWAHDPEAEALLSPEINPLLWADFRADSSLQQAARFWLVQKLLHGRCLLEAIGHDGGVTIAAMARRCAEHIEPQHYLSQLDCSTTITADTALSHYLSQGWKEGLDPSPSFCTEAALEQEPLLRDFDINPLYMSICGLDVASQHQQHSNNTHLQRFAASPYINPKFTWFSASPPGDFSSLELHWLIPDFAPGDASHRRLFRLVRWLERQGHRLTLWVLNPDRSRHAADLRDDVAGHDEPIEARVLELDASFFFSSGDAVIATSAPTLAVAGQAKGFKLRLHEPLENGEADGPGFEQALIERLRQIPADRSCDGIPFRAPITINSEQPRFKAAVVLPTHNAGPILQPVLNALHRQQTPWEFQCVLIDSASSDGTVELLKAFAKRQPNVSIRAIEKEDFQHGHTRNRGVAWSDAEFVAFLTQDAIPADQHWLHNLVSALEAHPKAAGVFGRHIAHDDAPYLINQELERYYEAIDQLPAVLSIQSDPEKIKTNNRLWRKILHFYSDNNSCLRKSIWQEIPLPCIPFGEDQLWAEAIIRRGYEKIYAIDAVVKHSHHYTAQKTYKRSHTEAEFYETCFGHVIHSNRHHMDHRISRDCLIAANQTIQSKGQCSAEDLNAQFQRIIAKHCGASLGQYPSNHSTILQASGRKTKE